MSNSKSRLSCAVLALANAVALTAAAVGPAQAAAPIYARISGIGTPDPMALPDLVVDLAGVPSFDGPGASGNTTLAVNATPGALVDAIAYHLSLTTGERSFLSEATVRIVNSAGDGIFFSPGFGDAHPGSGTYADDTRLSDLGIAFRVLDDGMLFFNFFEAADDHFNAADATYTAGHITLGAIGPIGVSAVPEPASWGLMALGLLGLAGRARHRSRRA